jgi:hypothetical protein
MSDGTLRERYLDPMFVVDRDRVDWRKALGGVLAIAIAVWGMGEVGVEGLTAGIAALMVTAAGGKGDLRSRLIRMGRFTLLGTALGALALANDENGWAAMLILGIVAYVGTMASALGHGYAKRGVLLTLWALLALIFGAQDPATGAASLAFFAGGATAMFVTLVRIWIGAVDAGASDPDDPPLPDHPFRTVTTAMRGQLGVYALLRAVALALAIGLGYWLIPEYRMWAAITVVVVAQPHVGEAVNVAIQRTVGTAIGAAAAVVVAQVLPQNDNAVAVAFLVSGFFLVAFQGANYVLFATFLTAMLVFAQRLVQGDAFDAGVARLEATLLGAVIAVGLLWLAGWIWDRRPATT